MFSLEFLLRTCGAVQISILGAALLVPRVFNWREELAKVDVFLRKLMWVCGAFIFFTVSAFAALSLLFAADLAAGTPLARAICLIIALFWLARLGVQFFYFDISHLKWPLRMRAGYHALTIAFVFLVAVFGRAALYKQP